MFVLFFSELQAISAPLSIHSGTHWLPLFELV